MKELKGWTIVHQSDKTITSRKGIKISKQVIRRKGDLFIVSTKYKKDNYKLGMHSVLLDINKNILGESDTNHSVLDMVQLSEQLAKP